MSKTLCPSRTLGAKTMFAVSQALKDRAGSLPTRKVINEIRKRVTFDNWALERYEATGAARWHSIMAFFSIDYVKAGYLFKKKGV